MKLGCRQDDYELALIICYRPLFLNLWKCSACSSFWCWKWIAGFCWKLLCKISDLKRMFCKLQIWKWLQIFEEDVYKQTLILEDNLQVNGFSLVRGVDFYIVFENLVLRKNLSYRLCFENRLKIIFLKKIKKIKILKDGHLSSSYSNFTTHVIMVT